MAGSAGTRLAAPDSWLTLVGLEWLKPGRQFLWRSTRTT